jgi:dihydroxyacid dehydratase/phosphogluconate dehydratase
MVGYRFNTIGVSDGISMGTDGMSFSLQSRWGQPAACHVSQALVPSTYMHHR